MSKDETALSRPMAVQQALPYHRTIVFDQLECHLVEGKLCRTDYIPAVLEVKRLT